MIGFLLEKEFKLLKRDRFLPKMILVMPVLMMLILPFSANFEVRDINLAVVDSDRSAHSSQLIQKIISSGYFRLVEFAPSYEVAMQSIEEGKSDIIFEIPPHFAHDLSLLDAQVAIAANAVNAIKGAMGSSYLASIATDFAREQIAASGMEVKPATEIVSQIRFNETLNYKYFMVPAMMVMLLAIMCGQMPALNIVTEKENGTMEQMNVTPVPKLLFIISKLIPYWIIGFFVLTLGLVMALVVYGLAPAGNLLTIYLATSLFVLAMSGMGLVVSNYSQTMQQAMFVMFFFMLILLLLSGLFTPIQSMPHWAQNITLFNPLRYFIEVMRGVYLRASTVGDVLTELGALSIFALALNAWAVVSYHKNS